MHQWGTVVSAVHRAKNIPHRRVAAACDIDPTRVASVAGRLRRPDGTQNLGVPFYSRVTPEAKAVLDTAAAVLDVPKWMILDAILRRTELDERGRPVWWSDEISGQEELPLARPA